MPYSLIVGLVILALVALLYVYLHHHGKKLTAIISFFDNLSKWFDGLKSDIGTKISSLESKVEGQAKLIDVDALKDHFKALVEAKVEVVVGDIKTVTDGLLVKFKADLEAIANDKAIQDKEAAAKAEADKLAISVKTQSDAVLAKVTEELGPILGNLVTDAISKVNEAAVSTVKDAVAAEVSKVQPAIAAAAAQPQTEAAAQPEGEAVSEQPAQQ